MMAFSNSIASLCKQGNVALAKTRVASIPSTDPRHELGLAVLAAFAKSGAECIVHARRALDLAPESVPPLRYLAIGYALEKDFETAALHAKSLAARDPSPDTRAGLGGLLLAGGHADEAKSILRQVVADEPSNAEALLNLGTASLLTGEHTEAIEWFAKALEEDPADVRPIQNVLAMLVERGKWLGAFAALANTRTPELPGNVSVLLDLVAVRILEVLAGDYPERHSVEEADMTVTRLLATSRTRRPRVRLAIAEMLIELSRIDEARDLVAELADSQLDDTDRGLCEYLHGLIAERSGDTERAVDSYSQAVATDPTRSDAGARAIALLLEDGSSEALTGIEAILHRMADQRRKTSPELMFNEAMYWQRRGRPVEARASLERVLVITMGEGRIGHLAKQALAELSHHNS